MASTRQSGNNENNPQESALLKDQIIRLSTRIQQQQESEDQERLLLLRQTRGEVFANILQTLTITALHVLDAIGQHEPINGIQIARQLAITKGGVSKITRKLLKQHLILQERLPNNKKDIYFRLTAQGREIFLWHHELHQQIEEQAKLFLGKYTLDELRLIVRFLEDYVENS
jgi:DNA-binding MarR family transcriptional regulator